MFSALLPRQCILRLLFLRDLRLDNLELFLSTLLCDLFFDHSANSISLGILHKRCYSFVLRFALHDLILLLGHVRFCHILESHMTTS